MASSSFVVEVTWAALGLKLSLEKTSAGMLELLLFSFLVGFSEGPFSLESESELLGERVKHDSIIRLATSFFLFDFVCRSDVFDSRCISDNYILIQNI